MAWQGAEVAVGRGKENKPKRNICVVAPGKENRKRITHNMLVVLTHSVPSVRKRDRS